MDRAGLLNQPGPKPADAEKFGSRQSAHAFALEALGHNHWEIGVAPPQGQPTGDFGGTPAAVRVTA